MAVLHQQSQRVVYHIRDILASDNLKQAFVSLTFFLKLYVLWQASGKNNFLFCKSVKCHIVNWPSYEACQSICLHPTNLLTTQEVNCTDTSHSSCPHTIHLKNPSPRNFLTQSTLINMYNVPDTKNIHSVIAQPYLQGAPRIKDNHTNLSKKIQQYTATPFKKKKELHLA